MLQALAIIDEIAKVLRMLFAVVVRNDGELDVLCGTGRNDRPPIMPVGKRVGYNESPSPVNVHALWATGGRERESDASCWRLVEVVVPAWRVPDRSAVCRLDRPNDDLVLDRL